MSSGANALHVSSPVDDRETQLSSPAPTYGTGALLAALSTVLNDTIGRFENLSGRVTENIRANGNAMDHELVVALQDFDRLQQEFAALGEVISNCATTAESARWGHGDQSLAYDAINAITLADMKTRLLNSLKINSLMTMMPQDGHDQVF